MELTDGAFYLPDGDDFVATELTRGPWDNRFQHGGPPSALLTDALRADGFFLARVTISLLRPVPIAKLSVRTGDPQGRRAQHVTASLFAGDQLVAEARGLRIRRAPLDVPSPPAPPPWPEPQAAPPHTFTFFRHEVGYHRAVELRVAHGAWGRTPVGFWARVRVPLVAGRTPDPLLQLMVLADAQSGMGVPLDPERYTFANPDLTVYLERDPVGPWFGFDIRSVAGPQGSGLSQSDVRDAQGTMARSAQALLIRLVPASLPLY
ncbi:MAG: thioesterase family protein [Myxococcales bacterium]|nr:thioesterase family protein [Myxococcales bacterium]